MKNTNNRKGFGNIISILAAMLLTASMSITALADGIFAGDITITDVAAVYEYKVYEVLDNIAAGGEASIFMATDSWKEFLETNENAVAMLVPVENDGSYPMADGQSALYTVNTESDKAVRQAFAEDVLQYAAENGIEATESRTAEDGDSEVAFTELMLGIYVIDTAGKARVTVMWDMEWQSEIKESYKPEDKAADTGTVAGENPEIQEGQGESESVTEESVVEEDAVTDSQNAEAAEAESAERVVESPLSAEEAPKGNGSIYVIIVAMVAVLAAAVAIFLIKKKK